MAKKKKNRLFDLSGWEPDATWKPKKGSLLESMDRRVVDPTVPDIGGFGYGRGRKGHRKDIDISGAAAAGATATPDIGAGGRPARERKRVPGIGAAGNGNSRRRRATPDIGAGGKPSDTGGRGPGGSGPAPNLSARMAENDPVFGRGSLYGADGRSPRGRLAGLLESTRNVGPAVAGFLGVRDELSADQERELDDFIQKAVKGGHDVTNGAIIRWRMNILTGRMAPADLWNTEIGQKLREEYGNQAEDLELAPDERPRRTYVERASTAKKGVRKWIRRPRLPRRRTEK